MHRSWLLLSIVLFAVSPCLCQSWEGLKEIRTGRKITVLKTNMQRLEGRFITASDEGIAVDTGGQQVTLRREEVARVSSKGHRVRNAILLGVAGTMIGAAVGHTQDSSLHGVRDGQGAIIGGIAGAVGGAAIPSGKTYFRAEKRNVGSTAAAVAPK